MSVPLESLPQVVQGACVQLREGLLQILGEDLVALWVYGALGWPLAVVITLAVIAYATWFDFAFVSVLPLDQAIAWGLLVQFIVSLVAIFCGFYFYPAVAGFLIWRAARTYPGRRIWRLLSYVVAAAFLLICGYENLSDAHTNPAKRFSYRHSASDHYSPAISVSMERARMIGPSVRKIRSPAHA